jgi:hypothetical protein
VLDVASALETRGGSVVLWVQTGGHHQRWTLEPDGQLCPRHHHQKLALNASGGAAVRGAPLVVWDRAAGHAAEPTQRWARTAAGQLASLADPGLVVGLATTQKLPEPGAMLCLVHATAPEALTWQWAKHYSDAAHKKK